MAQVPPQQIERTIEFLDLVKTAVANSVPGVPSESSEHAKNTATYLLELMVDKGIGLSFPDPPPPEEKPPF